MHIFIPHSTPKQGLSATKQATRESGGSRKFPKAKQLSLWESQNKPETELFSRKPQISSIPGISPKERNRYQVKVGSETLGTHLSIDEALLLANQSTHL
jgi:hypothetical protein